MELRFMKKNKHNRKQDKNTAEDHLRNAKYYQYFLKLMEN